jgi:hypothetical protein
MKYRLLLLTALLLCVVSCQEKGVENDPQQPEQSESATSFIQKFKGGAILTKFVSLGGTYAVSLDTDQAIYISKSDLTIVVCTPYTWPTITNTGGNWYIDDKHTGKPLTETAEDVVAGIYDGKGLYLWLSNGEIMFFHFDKAREVGYIRIPKSNNTFLEEDIVLDPEDPSQVNITLPLGGKNPETVVVMIAYRGTGLQNAQGKPLGNPLVVDFPSSTELFYTGFDGQIRKIALNLTQPKRIPVLRIDTEGKTPVTSLDDYLSATLTIEDPDLLYCTEPSQTLATNIRGRGNSTWGMPKKAYKIKLENKTRLLGMSNDKEWALLANYADKTLLRNATAFAMSEVLGMGWTPKFRPIELYLNDEYLGQYMLTEHVKVSSERINIELVTENDNSGEALTGGYFFEIDERMGEVRNFWTSQGVPINFKDPDEPTDAQFNYVWNYFNEAEKALYRDNFTDPATGYANYIDMRSFVHNYIIQELTRNVDGNMRLSNFLIKTRGGKIAHSNVWDFDLALGNCDYISYSTSGWEIKGVRWYVRMFQDPAFVALLQQEWDKLYAQLPRIEANIRDMALLIDDAQARNFKKWDILGYKVWPNPVALGSYEAELDYMLNFMRQRADWLNTEINKL